MAIVFQLHTRQALGVHRSSGGGCWETSAALGDSRRRRCPMPKQLFVRLRIISIVLSAMQTKKQKKKKKNAMCWTSWLRRVGHLQQVSLRAAARIVRHALMGPALPVDLWISSTSVPLTSSVSFLHWDRAEMFAKRSVERKQKKTEAAHA